MDYVFDASVVIKWYFEEEHTATARVFLQKLEDQEIEVIEPDLIYIELGNILTKSKSTTPRERTLIFNAIQEMPWSIYSVNPAMIEKIIATAKQYSLSFYDAYYVYLAQQYEATLVTADKKIVLAINNTKLAILLQ